MITSYIEALLTPQRRKWNTNIGDPVKITFSFMVQVPSYYKRNAPERKGFAPFTRAQKAAVRRALNLIEEITNIKFKEVSERVITISPIGQPLVLGGGNIRFGTAKLKKNIAGQADYPGPKSGGDVWLNNLVDSNSTQTNGSFGFQTLLHEIGHALGLKHPGNYNGADGTAPPPYLPGGEDNRQYTLMSYTAPPGSGVEPHTYMLYDIAALQYLYGANTTTKTENNTYSWDGFRPFSETIWDSAGIDTIDATSQIVAVNIDLQAGHFSSIGIKSPNNFITPAENNVAIAFGTVIENAIGGIRDDVIVGNEFNNNLNGGFGSDKLYGMQGDDTLEGATGDDQCIDFFGANTLIGGRGDDSYFISTNHNTITEQFDEGTDTVFFYGTDDYALGSNIENLDLVSASIVGRGNELANEITGSSSDNFLYGEGENDVLKGEEGNDELYGWTGNDTLYGGEGQDYIDGWEGDDLILGEAGNDVLVAWTGQDLVRGGADDDYLDGADGQDTLYGDDGNDTLYGNAGDDIIYGGLGADRIQGNSGNDSLEGQDGDDLFVFATGAPFSTSEPFSSILVGIDAINDFSDNSGNSDKIALSKETFTALQSDLGTGFSIASEFDTVSSDSSAETSSAFIVFNSVNRKLFYNPNGAASGFDVGGQFAILATNFALANNNFVLIT